MGILMARFRRRKKRVSESNIKACNGKSSTNTAPMTSAAQLQSKFGNGAIQRIYKSGVLHANLNMGVTQRKVEESSRHNG